VGVKAFLTKTVINVVKSTPVGASFLAKEQEKTISEIKAFTNESMGEFDDFGEIKSLPVEGVSEEKLFPSMIKLRGERKSLLLERGEQVPTLAVDSKQLTLLI
jgi:hypothetical protein